MAPAKEQKPQARITDVGSVTKAMSRMSPPSKKPEVKAAVPAVNGKLKSGITPPSSGTKQRSAVTNIPTTTRPALRPPSDTKTEGLDKMNNRTQTNPKGTVQGGGRAATGPSKPPATRAPVPRGPASGARSDLVPCKTCGRNFAPDRIQAHNEICARTSKKKRKPFDVTKQRVKGTELESFVKKGKLTTTAPKKTDSKLLQPPLTKSNWRKKHEEFIANIRAAKQAQQHVARGGKLSDLPPPPPMDTSDLIPCPHCGRKFNEGAAERHIPKCATFLHNKPKPGPTNTKGRTTTSKR